MYGLYCLWLWISSGAHILQNFTFQSLRTILLRYVNLDHESGAHRTEAEQGLHHLVHHLDLGDHDLPGPLHHPHHPQLHHLEQAEAGQAQHQGAHPPSVQQCKSGQRQESLPFLHFNHYLHSVHVSHLQSAKVRFDVK